MYSEHGIDTLSKSQISRLLNGHAVRVKHGGIHRIKLSHEQSKKYHKSAMHGKGFNLHLDPFQISDHQHLRGGELSYDKFANNPNIKRIASAATDRAVKGIAGSGLSYDKFANNPNIKRIASAATDRAVKGIAGGSLSYDKFANNPNIKRIASAATDRAVKGIAGGSVNRINKFNRWTGALGQAYQGVARAVAPVAKPIFHAGTEAAVSYINPTPEDLIMQSMGGSIRKRGRPRKMHGSALHQSGSSGGAMHQSGSTGGKVHRKKKHGLLFDL